MSENSDTQHEPLLHHEYDGIRELDNPLPAWWLATFYVTIIFGFIYWIHYEFGGGLSSTQELNQSLARIESLRPKNAAPSEEELKKLIAAVPPESSGAALSIYTSKCAACHGPQGEGLIGPNLTDNAWIHGRGTRQAIYTVVYDGVASKGMPGWGAQLSKDEMIQLVAFVHELRKSPRSGRPPQGEVVADGGL